MDLSDYDFIDFGASGGGCIDFAKKYLGAVSSVCAMAS